MGWWPVRFPSLRCLLNSKNEFLGVHGWLYRALLAQGGFLEFVSGFLFTGVSWLTGRSVFSLTPPPPALEVGLIPFDLCLQPSNHVVGFPHTANLALTSLAQKMGILAQRTEMLPADSRLLDREPSTRPAQFSVSLIHLQTHFPLAR